MNFTKAAKALNITQPAVSQHIQYLEDYYGVELFAFEGKKMRLTKAGKMLYQAATTIKPVSYTHLDVYKRQVHAMGIHVIENTFPMLLFLLLNMV